MTDVWVLGNGQLGAMLQHAAMPLALKVSPVDIDQPLPADIAETAVITAEREHWPATKTASHLFNHPNFINRRAFEQLPDRKSQKQLLDSLGLATAKWQDLDAQVTSDSLFQALGERVLLKRRTGGYDGKGQLWLRQAEAIDIPAEWRGQAIAEQAIGFQDEASIIGVRSATGACEFYPLTLNLHMDGILMASIAPVQRLQALQPNAEAMLRKLMDALDYVGVMAMECFLVNGELMVNEVAPRVHNSGHWTQAGSTISQFEYHLRAVRGLPLAPAQVKNTSVMLNLIGTDYDERWLSVPGAEVYWYGKAVLPGRKLGHINFCPATTAEMDTALEQSQTLLPARYGRVLEWVYANLGLH